VFVTLPSGSCTQSPGPVVAFGTGGGAGNAPTIALSTSDDITVQRYDTVAFNLTVSDADADTVSLRLLNPPAGATFAAATGLASGSVRTFRWMANGEQSPVLLTFQAKDSTGLATLKNV